MNVLLKRAVEPSIIDSVEERAERSETEPNKLPIISRNEGQTRRNRTELLTLIGKRYRNEKMTDSHGMTELHLNQTILINEVRRLEVMLLNGATTEDLQRTNGESSPNEPFDDKENLSTLEDKSFFKCSYIRFQSQHVRTIERILTIQ
ncbi:hypothetical protein KIN20_024348 [Parelaphostrongylus tenuis]|uniref:Uncharacterized protein n=1 Tax=Parelaphostrongylus tenuis TaxID=148309 RepID=A0AAD5MTA4_PARTN|nr:hypothetical protein KIN20_024348 [Parelaphostrongylus tenuis]